MISNETWQRVWWSAALMVLGMVGMVLALVYLFYLHEPVMAWLFLAIGLSSFALGTRLITRISAERSR